MKITKNITQNSRSPTCTFYTPHMLGQVGHALHTCTWCVCAHLHESLDSVFFCFMHLLMTSWKTVYFIVHESVVSPGARSWTHWLITLSAHILSLMSSNCSIGAHYTVRFGWTSGWGEIPIDSQKVSFCQAIR